MHFGLIKNVQILNPQEVFQETLFSQRLIEFSTNPANSNKRSWWSGKAAIINHEHSLLFFIRGEAARAWHKVETWPGRRRQYVRLWFGRGAIVSEHIHRHLDVARPFKFAFVMARAALTANTKWILYKFIWTLGDSDTVIAFFMKVHSFRFLWGRIGHLGWKKYEQIAFVL